MKKQYLGIIVVAFFILGYVLDLASGPILIPLSSPFAFLNEEIISTYPFTTVSIGLKALGIFIGVLLLLSFIEQKQLGKAGFVIFLVALLELYSIQQIATGGRIVSLQWSLALSFSGLILIIPALIYFIIGISKLFYNQVVQDPYSKEAEELDL